MAALILSPHSDNLAKQLFYASGSGRDQEVLELLQRGAPPNNSDYYTRERDGRTPLHMACVCNHFHSAELLIKFGAIVVAKGYDGWTPYTWHVATTGRPLLSCYWSTTVP